MKAAFGWSAVRVQNGACGAQVLFRRLPLGFSVAYIPKGPLGPSGDWPALWPELDRLCRQRRAVFLLVEPDASEPLDPLLAQHMAGFGTPADPIQPRRTLLVDLRGSESDWLARMSKTTRHCFKVAVQNDVKAVYSQDIEAFIQLMQQTGQRASLACTARLITGVLSSCFHPASPARSSWRSARGAIWPACLSFATARARTTFTALPAVKTASLTPPI